MEKSISMPPKEQKDFLITHGEADMLLSALMAPVAVAAAAGFVNYIMTSLISKATAAYHYLFQ